MNTPLRSCFALVLAFLASSGCSDGKTGPDPNPVETPSELVAEGRGPVTDRFTSELWVNGNTAYTGTWGTLTGTVYGDAIKIWDVSAPTPVLVDSLIVPGATVLGDVQATADGRFLVVATEAVGSIAIYDLQNPRSPVLVTRFQNDDIINGVHTAEVQPVNGRLYAFLSIDPRGGNPARLVVVDITDPSAPTMVFSRVMGDPFVHDVFVRDGILMTALWNAGVSIFDIGGGGSGGTIENPVQLGNVKTKGGKVHNIFWYHDPVTGSRQFALVGEEGPGSTPSSSSGDVHVIDVSDMTQPHEVAFFSVPGAGVHNFSADEARGILYAAYYNGGVRALNIRGDLGSCSALEKASDGRCDLGKMNRELARGPLDVGFPIYIWGVHYSSGRLFASDMINGLWRLSTVPSL